MAVIRLGGTSSYCAFAILKKHVFFGTRIDQSIAAGDVLNWRVETARLFQFLQARQFLYRSASSKDFGSKKSNPH
jgi:hypothetical protein